MGYLDNTSITVDAILTNKGRELLAQGANAFNITQFALGDDEIDYTLWNPADTRGTAFYGAVIENMPVTEAIPEQTKLYDINYCHCQEITLSIYQKYL